ncbi:MAG: hypothetical protein QGG64_20730, partial [Candidatus Latescibacteria bacterium]|nr:hypothetical protein [Candidatus Latescibacterota bacterium]
KKKDDADSVKSSTSRPAKKRPAKKAAKKARSNAVNKDEERTVISSPPSRRRESQKAIKPENEPQETSEPKSSEAEEATSMQWGRRSRRSAPIGWEDHAGGNKNAQSGRRQEEDKTAEAPAESKASAEPAETPSEPAAPPVSKAEAPVSDSPAENPKENKSPRSDRSRNRGRSEKSDQDNRRQPRRTDRGRSRGRSEKSDQDNRRQPRQSSDKGRSRGRDEKADSKQPSRTLTAILAESWTEDKTRRYLSEGFLGSLSPGLINTGKQEPLPDTDALKESLQMIRKVLADECMVADDVTDLMLLDVVMNALSDRIEVCRLQAESKSLEDMDMILDLRYKADRRLIEAVNALKNA